MEVVKIPKKEVIVIKPQKSFVVDKQKYQQKRVAAYCRVSTDSDEQYTSYVNQKKVYTEMIVQNKEWCLAGIYADEGISGTRADKRTEFKRMINDCLSNKIDMIITKSVSRFARNTVECLEYVRMLRNRGIGIYFEEQNIDTLKCDSEMYLVIHAGFAQSESESMSKNITWSYRKRFEAGNPIFTYNKWLGYKKGANGLPEIIPEEAVIIERIYDLYLSGETTQSISDMLKAENIIIPNKKISFNKSVIHSILTNERYTGDSILQKTVTVDCISKIRRKNQGEAPMYYVRNSHPAIISSEKFNKVQEEMARRKVKRPQMNSSSISKSGRYSRNPLSEVTVCEECGSRYKRCTWAKNGKKKIVWRCSNRLEHGTKYCHESPTIDEKELKEAVVRAVNKFSNKDGTTYTALMNATIGDAIGLNKEFESITILENRIESLNKKMMDLINDSVRSSADIEVHEEEFKCISEEITQLENRIKTIQEMSASNDSAKERILELQKIIKEHESTTNEYNETIVRQMVECIKVHKDKRIEVIFGGGILFEI